MVIIRESKRDDLLLPYLEVVRSKGVNMSLGQFKTYMLELLSAKGGIHNLSLSSNYYLAGVTKYYFNGDLTLNKNLSVFDPSGNSEDQWNNDVCRRLNALVLVLRNAYIDTVGEKFEIEEDFGTLSLPKLLRKYNKKINEILGIVTVSKKKKGEEPEKVYDHNVGNDYTYEILYDFNQGTKFERYTAPGAWCITYGSQYYNMYIKRLGIHYVIFLKNGYENVKRQVGPGFTKQKPHDEYGNSMIAVLQSNDNWNPVYITSRWNHGHGDTSGTEADHAYTLDEFCNITGVTPEDLQRIWQEWKENRTKVHRETDPHKAELREEKAKVLRILKYTQMRLNGGESFENLIRLWQRVMGAPTTEGGVNIKKGIFVASLKPASESENFVSNYKFVIDRGKILFDTLQNIRESRKYYEVNLSSQIYGSRYGSGEDGPIQNVIIITTDSGYMLYDTRRKDYVTVDGVKKFKYLPYRWGRTDGKNPMFYQVALRGTQRAFIFCANNQPLKLPNGSCWFSSYVSREQDPRRDYDREVKLKFAGLNTEPMLEIIYDDSSREKYFYNVKERRFIRLPDIGDLWQSNSKDEIILSRNVNADGLYGLQYKNDSWSQDAIFALFNEKNQRISLGGLNRFFSVREANEYDSDNGEYSSSHKVLIVKPEGHDALSLKDRGYNIDTVVYDILYDVELGCFAVFDGNTLATGTYNSYTIYGPYVAFRIYTMGGYYYYLYDTQSHGFLINPYGHPNKYLFEVYSGFGDYEPGNNIIDVFDTAREAGVGYWNDRRERKKLDVDKLKIDQSTLRFAEANKNNYDNVQTTQQPAVSLAEQDIRAMVAEAIKKITTNI